MLSAIAIIPSTPVLVPELVGAAAAEVSDLAGAVIAAAAILPPCWIVIGADRADDELGPNALGTFAGFGVDVPVFLAPHIGSWSQAPDELPLCALIAGWVRGRAQPEASVQVRVNADDHVPDSALARGRQLRADIDRLPDPVGVLVVADGVNTLTPRAPGGYDSTGADAQKALDDALANGDAAGLMRVGDQVRGRVAFQVLAGLTEPGPQSAKELYRGAPFGVGYFVGVWQP